MKKAKLIPLFLVFVLQLSGCAQAGHFEDVGNTNLPRLKPSLVECKDGRVLVLGGVRFLKGRGGYDAKKPLPEEIYDPISRSFDLISPMNQKRSSFSAILLPNGNVFIAGGLKSSYTALSSTEIYNPQSGKFTIGPELSGSRAQHAAIALENGNVLLFGGTSKKGGLTSVELYDYKTNTVQLVGNTVKGGAFLRALYLRDGRILLGGGFPPDSNFEIYDPKTHTSQLAGSMRHPRGNFVWAPLKNGKVLIAGSLQVEGPRVAEVYDPQTMTSKEVGAFNKITSPYQAQCLSDGKVLVSGEVNLFFRTDSIELYDPETEKFTVVENYINNFMGYSILGLKDGSALMFGYNGEHNQQPPRLYLPN